MAPIPILLTGTELWWKTGENTKNIQSVLGWQGTDLAGEGGRGQDPSPACREQVGPGGAKAGFCGRGPREGRGVGCPVCRDISQNQSQRRQGTSTPLSNLARYCTYFQMKGFHFIVTISDLHVASLSCLLDNLIFLNFFYFSRFSLTWCVKYEARKCQKTKTKTEKERTRRTRRASKKDAVYFELFMDLNNTI